VLIDPGQLHLFQPLLYQVATAALSPGDIAEPLRAILRKYPNVEVLLGEVATIDPAVRRVTLSDGLRSSTTSSCLATGAQHSTSRIPMGPLRRGLKSLADALELAAAHFSGFRARERESDPAKQTLYVVVVGGGPTGVELRRRNRRDRAAHP